MALKQEREVSQTAVDRAVEKTREMVQQKMEDVMKVGYVSIVPPANVLTC